MIGERSTGPVYGNWVSAGLIRTVGAVAVILIGLSFLIPIVVVAAAPAALALAYFVYARYRFSPRGGDIQGRIQGLLLDGFKWDGQGQALDIGCGNGPLTIALAKKFPEARITGLDYWGRAWEYSKGVCERNAALEGVGERVVFQQGSASALPFADESFDAVISNLTFHEVRDIKDKRLAVKEALRVVRPGGCFAFQDLFLWKMVYGPMDDLVALVRSWGIEEVELIDTSDSAFIPRPLRLPFMVGTIGILRGRK
jgi:SAM-dependent methyltransferase